ncbi:MAG: DUF4981 domain-containing protein [Bacteroidetes bacterium]|nr:MAG: DUF4981 domain-containing protein [Bacteroidota bacterium]
MRNGEFRVHNKNFFKGLNDRKFKWSLKEDGIERTSGFINMGTVAPQEKKEFSIKLPTMDFSNGQEYLLKISALNNDGDALIPMGHQIAWEEFALNQISYNNEVENNGRFADLKTYSSTDTLFIQGQNFLVALHKYRGELLHYEVDGKSLLSKGMQPNFWRPPTDNDLGNGMHKWAEIWKDAGSMAISTFEELLDVEPEVVTFKVRYDLHAMNNAKVWVTYSVRSDASIDIHYLYESRDEELPKIPRVGLQWELPDEFQFMQWYGKGPHETYWDRKSSGETGIWQGQVWEQLHRYPRPQESGNKTEVRWMSLTNKNGQGLKVSTTSVPLSMSAWQLKMEELDFVAGKKGAESASGLVPVTSKHGADLIPGAVISWNIDLKQMGLGGDTSWGRHVHDEYTLSEKKYDYSFRITPVGFDN